MCYPIKNVVANKDFTSREDNFSSVRIVGSMHNFDWEGNPSAESTWKLRDFWWRMSRNLSCANSVCWSEHNATKESEKYLNEWSSWIVDEHVTVSYEAGKQ